MWWKKNKWKVIIPVLAIAVLAAAFWYGGGSPGLHGWGTGKTAEPEPATKSLAEPGAQPAEPETVKPEKPAENKSLTPEEEPKPEQEPEQKPGAKGEPLETVAPEPEPEVVPAMEVETGDAEYSEAQGMELDPENGKDKYRTDPVPEGKPIPVEPEDVVISDTAYTCTLSISCATILNHMDWLDPEKTELVPEDGWILQPMEVTFYEGENVFNVLQRTCKQQKIHMEFSETPMYNSAYIEGIHNLYEFDCGELSGWMYKVNEWFPNYGCSRYQLQNGDVICWVYTCDLGEDVGGKGAIGG